MNSNQITIIVSGGDAETKNLLASEVQAALTQRRFTNVQVDWARPHQNKTTVMDAVRSLNPEFFNIPVRIVPEPSSSQSGTAPFDFCGESISMLPYDLSV